eukprot:gene24466-29571_t
MASFLFEAQVVAVVAPTPTTSLLTVAKAPAIIRSSVINEFLEIPISFKRKWTAAELHELQWPIITNTTSVGNHLTDRTHMSLMSVNDHKALLRRKSERMVLCFLVLMTFLLIFGLYTSGLCTENPEWYSF